MASSSRSIPQKESVVFDGRRNRISHDSWVDSLTVDYYQDLLDRGWRRCGCLLYNEPKTTKRTCRPSYTIRLKANDFVRSKEQHRVPRRLQRFLDGTLDVKGVFEGPTTSKKSEICVRPKFSNPKSEEPLTASNEEQNKVEEILHYLSDQIDNVVHMSIEKGESPSQIQLPKAAVRKVSQGKKKLLVNGSEDLLYSSNVAFQIAAFIKKAQSGHKSRSDSQPAGDCEKENGSSPKIIAEKLVASLDPMVKNSGLSIRACNGHINFYAPTKEVSPCESVQNAAVPKKSGVMHDSRGNCSSSLQNCQVKKRKLEIRLKRSSFDADEFALYRRYQVKVHNNEPDHVTESSYRRFLVDTPLLYVSPTGDSKVPPCGFGSFHQQYLIDGQLVAVGVIDILPKCLSSKYFFWDPDFAFLSLGKYSALQEIDWVKENQVYCPSLQYYYLGYYTHSCSKMRYKATYRPSELLCPFRYQWVPFDIARPLLDIAPCVVLSDALQNGDSSLPLVTEDTTQGQLDDIDQEDAIDFPMDENEETVDSEESYAEESSDEESAAEESSDDESGLETTTDGDPENGDVSKVSVHR